MPAREARRGRQPHRRQRGASLVAPESDGEAGRRREVLEPRAGGPVPDEPQRAAGQEGQRLDQVRHALLGREAADAEEEVRAAARLQRLLLARLPRLALGRVARFWVEGLFINSPLVTHGPMRWPRLDAFKASAERPLLQMPHRSPNAARIAGSVEGVGMSSLSARAPTGQKTAVQSRSVIQLSPAGNMDSLYAPRLQCLW